MNDAPRPDTHNSKALGGDRQLLLEWAVEDLVEFRLRCRLFADNGVALIADRVLTKHAPTARIDLQPVFGDPHIARGEVALQIRPTTRELPGEIALWCDIPLSRSSLFRHTLDTWPLPERPHPDPSPDPFDPSVDDEGHVRAPWGGAIEPHSSSVGVLDFLWVDDAPFADRAASSFIAFTDALPYSGVDEDALPLVAALKAAKAQAKDAAEALAAMQKAAGQFVESAWPPTSAQQALGLQLIDMIEMMAISSIAISPEDMVAWVESEVGPIEAFIAEEIEAPTGLYSLAWQLAWAGALAQPLAEAQTPLEGLVDLLESLGEVAMTARALALVLRVASQTDLSEPAARRRLSRAVLLAPSAVCPPPGADSVQCLGVGLQKSVEHRLEGYRLGEIAEILNLMPGEQLKLLDRERSLRAQRDLSQTRKDDAETRSEQATSSRNLIEDLRDALSQAEVVRNYTGLQAQEGDWPELKIGGSWWGQDGGQERAIGTAAAFIQDLSRNVASSIAQRVVEERSVTVVREQESVETRRIDNRSATTALHGVYHWLESVHHLKMRTVGRHLVLEALLASPAERLVAATLQQPHLEAPLPPSTWGISCDLADYASVTAENFASAASAYGVEVPAPPAVSITVRAQLSSAQPAGQLSIPEGYAAANLAAAYVVSDASLTLLALAATQPIPLSAAAALAAAPRTATSMIAAPSGLTTPDPPPPPAIPDPQTYSWTPAKPGSGQGSLTFATAASGAVPLACFYGGASFNLVVEAQCAPLDASARLAQWQIAAHRSILDAYDTARTRHAAAVREAILGQAKEGVGRLIANELTLAGLAALAVAAPRLPPSNLAKEDAPPALTGQEARFFTEALDWKDATYAFFPWGVDPIRRPSPVLWAGQATLNRNDPAWFASFMDAGSARMLVTVRRGYEVATLFFLTFGYLPGRQNAVLAPEPIAAWLEELRSDHKHDPEHCWRLQVPTTHAVLTNHLDLAPRGRS